MPLLLILEDTTADLRKAADIARSAGFTEFEVNAFATRARRYLEEAINGEGPLPDAILVDLELGFESGFELLRFWHGNQKLRHIPVIIWTVMGAHEREICDLFGVYGFVSKDDSPDVLRAALANVLANTREP